MIILSWFSVFITRDINPSKKDKDVDKNKEKEDKKETEAEKRKRLYEEFINKNE